VSAQFLKAVARVSAVTFALALISCSNKASGEAGQTTETSSGRVQGHVYHGNGDVVVVEFKSNGKAFVSTGPVSTPCTYSQKGNNVTLICEKDTTKFTVDPDDGALIGPSDGFLGRLTRKQ
jgi:hypothetical protein